MGKGGYGMLKQWIPAVKPEKEELEKRLDAAQEELGRLQMQIKEHKLPVLVLIEGWEAEAREVPSVGSLKILIRDFSRWRPCPHRRRKRNGNLSCIVIL